MLQSIGIVAVLVIFVAFSLVVMYFSYILGIGVLIISLVVIVYQSIKLMSS